MTAQPHICQVAFSALHAFALRRWYHEVFNLLYAGQTVFFPPATSNVQGLPGAWERCGWLVDGQDYFQLEFFQFLYPESRPTRQRHAFDIGYRVLGIYCADFAGVLGRAVKFGGRQLEPVNGERPEREVLLEDPEGNRLRVFETDPLRTSTPLLRPEMKTAVRSMTLSVPELDEAVDSFSRAFGLAQQGDTRLNGDDARPRRALLQADNFILELIEHPAPQPWPDHYRISDQGFMNIAIGYRDAEQFDRAFAVACDAGFTPNGKPTEIGVFKVMYVNSPQGFSVEMLAARKRFWRLSGFKPVCAYLENTVWIDAPLARVWQDVTDHQNMGMWCLFNGTVVQPGSGDANGLDAVRQLSFAGLRVTERITRWQPNESFSYSLVAGAPLKNHRGDIMLCSVHGGTELRWSVRFDAVIPCTGTIMAWGLKWIFARALQRLKQHLES